MKKKLLIATFAIASVIGFNQFASARVIRVQVQEVDTQDENFDLTAGTKFNRMNCNDYRNSIYNKWIAAGANHDQADAAGAAAEDNCACAQGWTKYCS